MRSFTALSLASLVFLLLLSCASTKVEGPLFATEEPGAGSCMLYIANEKGMEGYPGGLTVKVLSYDPDIGEKTRELGNVPMGGYMALRLEAGKRYILEFSRNYTLLFSGAESSSSYVMLSGKLRTASDGEGTSFSVANGLFSSRLVIYGILKGATIDALKAMPNNASVPGELKEYKKVGGFAL